MTDHDPDHDLHDDDVLLGLLGEALDEAEPIPPGLAETVADAAFDMRRIDAVIAQLVHDSELTASGTRGDARSLVYSEGEVELELEIADDGTVHGLVQPAAIGCEIETPTGTESIEVDGSGRFDLSISDSRFRLILTPASGRRIATPWVFR
jgi:hypothetical protein